MARKSKQEIETEIKKLKALKPVGSYRSKIAGEINSAVEELELGVDQTAEEWNEMTWEERDTVQQTIDWKNGDNPQALSEGFKGCCE
jgi:hypothetical protein